MSDSIQMTSVSDVQSVSNIDDDITDEVQVAIVQVKHGVNYYRIPVFLLAFVSYGLYHASRKTLSSVKETFRQEITHQSLVNNQSQYGALYPQHTWIKNTLFTTANDANGFFGYLDAIFMVFYAAGLYIFGWLGDRFDPRYVLSIGMVLSGITLFLFGCLPFYAPVLMCEPYLLIIYAVFGLVQASGWPAEVTIISNWFGPAKRGLVLGLYASCQSVGNIVGSLVISHIVPFGCEDAFLTMSTLMVTFGIIIFCAIISHPSHVGIIICPESDSEKDDTIPEEDIPPISFVKAILLPGVIAYCLCNACLKLVNYGFFFWLPLYLSTAFGYSNSVADTLSIWYDIGAVIGSVSAGFLTDLLGFRSPVIVTMIFTSIGALYGYLASPAIGTSMNLNAFVMTVLGALIGGSYNLIAGTVAADLGRQPELAGNSQALSTVTGLIDGTGSVGSAIGQAVIPPLQKATSINSIFYLFIVMNFLAGLFLCQMLVKECRILYRRYRQSRNDVLTDDTSPLLCD